MLERISIPSSVDRRVVSPEIRLWINDARNRIEAFQDRWDRPLMEQFVAADYELVYQTLAWAIESQMLIGRRFLEWGCGFAVVSALASTLDLDVIGIEAEADLLDQGRGLTKDWNVNLELVCGNFLPADAEHLADDPTLPSLGHAVESAYEMIGLDLDDFAIVYSYPWPGEDDFHERVFQRHAARGALLMQFCGPNDVRLWRKRS
ncbi:class I SAM-dependent methyltransferase [Planctomycetes bacterium CA13]|uniref:class I SAM-dependent methyltransferase n=1 Tax=Novipirellula herctigrandis TaxID=2527986 RepID=UPI0011B5C6E1